MDRYIKRPTFYNDKLGNRTDTKSKIETFEKKKKREKVIRFKRIRKRGK